MGLDKFWKIVWSARIELRVTSNNFFKKGIERGESWGASVEEVSLSSTGVQDNHRRAGGDLEHFGPLGLGLGIYPHELEADRSVSLVIVGSSDVLHDSQNLVVRLAVVEKDDTECLVALEANVFGGFGK